MASQFPEFSGDENDNGSEGGGFLDEVYRDEEEVEVPSSPEEAAPSAGGSGSDYDPGQRRRRRRRRRRGGRQGDNRGPQGGPSQHRHRHHRGGGDYNGRERTRERAPDQDFDASAAGTPSTYEGVLELHPKGYGFLRDPKNNYASIKSDPFVPGSLIEKHRLREGILIRGEIVPGSRGQGPRLRSIETIDGRDLDVYAKIKTFDELTAVNPFERIRLEIGPAPVTMRVMDLLTPLGKGQRALIVAPPRTGKTMLLQEIANSVSINHPEVHLIVLLIDERKSRKCAGACGAR
jgi:transcription termination factor Rho